jgi:hypothetical protein
MDATPETPVPSSPTIALPVAGQAQTDTQGQPTLTKSERETDAVFRANYETLLNTYKNQVAINPEPSFLTDSTNKIRNKIAEMKNLEKNDPLIGITKLFNGIFRGGEFITNAERGERLLKSSSQNVNLNEIDPKSLRKTDAQVRAELKEAQEAISNLVKNTMSMQEAGREKTIEKIETLAQQVREIERENPLTNLTKLFNGIRQRGFHTDAGRAEKLAWKLRVTNMNEINIQVPIHLDRINKLSEKEFRYLIKNKIFDNNETIKKMSGQEQLQFYKSLPPEKQNQFMDELFSRKDWSYNLYKLLEHLIGDSHQHFDVSMIQFLQAEHVQKHLIIKFDDRNEEKNFYVNGTESKKTFQKLLNAVPIINHLSNPESEYSDTNIPLDKKLDKFDKYLKLHNVSIFTEIDVYRDTFTQIPAMFSDRPNGPPGENFFNNEVIKAKMLNSYLKLANTSPRKKLDYQQIFNGEQDWYKLFKAALKHDNTVLQPVPPGIKSPVPPGGSTYKNTLIKDIDNHKLFTYFETNIYATRINFKKLIDDVLNEIQKEQDDINRKNTKNIINVLKEHHLL